MLIVFHVGLSIYRAHDGLMPHYNEWLKPSVSEEYPENIRAGGGGGGGGRGTWGTQPQTIGA
jgi:hypothetical protein